MEVKAKQLDSVNAAASVKIPSGSINTEVENLAKKASKTIKMDGFRPGKVPVSAVLKRYEKELRNDAEQNLFKNAVDSALKELKKDLKELVGEPYFEKFERENDAIIAELVLSFKPKLKLDGYEKCIPEFSTPKVSKKEIDEKKNELLKRYATTEAIKTKRALKEGDYAKFDFEGFVDGKAFDGGKAENYVLEIGSKQFIPGFEEAMVGMKSGEEKDISVTFPKEYGAANLAGKDAIFKIKLHEIQELKFPELNEELLKKLLPNEEKASEELLDEKLKEQIKNEKLFKLINEELKAKFADSLIETFEFDLPKGILEQEIDMQFRQAFGAFSEEEKKEIQNDKDKYEAKRNSFKDEAKKSVKLTFIIDELAKLRKIEVSDQELVQAVYFEAYRYGFNPKEHLENYKKQGALPAVKMALIEEKLFNDIFMPKEKAKKEKKEDK
ncbi:trigger factor [Campylobacter upsaliensis]|uniref:trigger factor n=1 Tax=Campylobacter upsaliensis TaxID=28080 RepID=UPI0012DBB7D2|nr:trigger factor [Campylobacter upsaliensis]EAI2045534.1 trigger factor [Campylobacter upsaliensis]EAI2445602.1 trigger factor [Campylobacter upsaliensis]ECQ8136983.1 trigger factor [Campylobacter upsaliensis]EDP6913879.1 trigger factor [Campylobacter upsaliensis]EIW2411218.1 trigger factor [Campylobacter upsaliensis]